nr:unnamed protein product [Spirometra erinaceieuropaei]
MAFMSARTRQICRDDHANCTSVPYTTGDAEKDAECRNECAKQRENLTEKITAYYCEEADPSCSSYEVYGRRRYGKIFDRHVMCVRACQLVGQESTAKTCKGPSVLIVMDGGCRCLRFGWNRTGHLFQFLTQQAGHQAFNRAKLFNVAVKEIRKSAPGDRLHGIDCFIFHDVDKVPTSSSTVYECGQNVRQLATAFRSDNGTRWLYRGFLGAATALSWDHVEKINGASNIFYGWGGEDDDLAIRY